MKRLIKALLVILAAALLLLSLGLLWLVNDEELLRGQIEQRVSHLTGRQLTLDGLDFELGQRTSIRIPGIRLTNPGWAKESYLVSIDFLEVDLDLEKLLDRQVTIERLALSGVQLNLEKNDVGDANWNLMPRDEHDDGEPPRLKILWGELSLANFRLAHLTPEREVPLDFQVSRLIASKTEGGINLEAQGVVGGYTLNVDGFVGPLLALSSGGPMEHDLRLTLGDISLSSQGRIEDARTGAGAHLTARFAGPEVEWLLRQAALPGFTSGPFDANLEFQAIKDGGIALSLDGDLGSFKASASGSLDRLRNPSRFNAEFSVTGPDLRSLGETLRLRNLPEGPYRADGELDSGAGALELKRLQIDMEEHVVTASGTLALKPRLAGTVLNVAGHGPDVRIWGPTFHWPRLAEEAYAFEGPVHFESEGLGLDGVDVEMADSRAKIDGLIRLPLRKEPNPAHGWFTKFEGSRFHADLTTPNLQVLGSALGLPPLPEQTLDLEANGKFTTSGLELEVDSAHLGVMDFTLAGILPFPKHFQDATADFSVVLPSLRDLKALSAEPKVPDLPLGVSGHVSQISGGFDIAGAKGKVGNGTVTFDGQLIKGDSWSLRDARFSLSGPEFREFFDHESLAGLPGDFNLSGDLTTGDRQQEISRLRLGLGRAVLQLSGTSDRLPLPERFDLQIQFEAPGTAEFQPFIDRYVSQPLPDFPLHASFLLQGSWSQLDIGELQGRIGNSEFNGWLSVVPGSAPEIRGALDFSQLDLAWMRDEERAQATPGATDADQAGGAGGSKSDRVFTDVPLPILSLPPLLVKLDLSASVAKLPLATLEKISLGLELSQNALQLDLHSLTGEGGGQFSGVTNVRIADDRIFAVVKARAEGMRVGLTAADREDLSTWPPWDLLVDVETSGSTMHELAVSSSGGFGVIIGPGKITSSRVDLLFSDILSELFEHLNPFAKKRSYTNLECSVARVTLADGAATVDPMIMQTEELIITSGGTVDLASEELDLSFNTRPKKGLGISTGVIINPFIKVGGNLAHPAVALDPSSAVLSGGAAVATAGLSLLGQSLFDRYIRDQDACSKVGLELRKMYENRFENP